MYKISFKNLALVGLVILLSASISFGQLVVSDPAFPTDNQSVTITFDASLGSGGLAGYTGDVYAHTGVITNLSSSASDWRYVKTNWGENTPETKLTNIGTDLYTLTITPSIRDYYGVPSSETILQIALVFRSDFPVGGSYLEGKTASGGDIFVDVVELGLNVDILIPDEAGIIVELNDNVPVQAVASLSDSLALYVNNNLITEVAGTELNYTLNANSYGKSRVKVVAWDNSSEIVDSFYYFVRPAVTVEALPADVEYGINYIDDQTVILCLYAPYKEYAFAIGDFSNWEVDESNYMKRTPAGNVYWVEIDSLTPGQEYIYQYYVDGEIKIGDPYAEKVSDPWNDSYIENSTYPNLIAYPAGKTTGIATVFQTDQDEYTWNTTNFIAPANKDLVIYELLVRDFTEGRNIQSVIDTLGYLENLGVNAIELMPVNEFEGNLSWGYNPDYYFAFDKYYGPKNEYKHFIDLCHEHGIAVIMDIALNHSFGQSPMVELYWDAVNNQPAGNNPWFNQQPMHDFNVGYDFNHESPATKYFVNRVVRFWLDEFNIDGYRFDLSKGFTQTNTLGNVGAWGHYDASRIAILEAISDSIWDEKPNAYVILEHFADNDEETVLANYGMMLWGNMNYNYNEATMGWTSNNISWGAYTSRGWSQPNLVTYMESHDEERLMYKNLQWGNSNGSYNTKEINTALARMELAANFFLTIPGPKMIWQFGELGYDVSIDFNGRTGIKPLKWEYFYGQSRNRLFHVYKALIDLKKTQAVFGTSDFSMSVDGYMKRINLNHSSMNVTVIGNFDVSSGTIDPNFQTTGTWYDYFTGDSIIVNDVHSLITLDAGEYHLYTSNKLTVPVLISSIDENEPASQTLLKVFPNPSSSRFNFVLESNSNSDIVMSIYNSSGQIIKSVKSGNSGRGLITISWDGKNESGYEVGPGLYFAIAQNGAFRKSAKLIKQ